jgi:hypothetical protein
MRGKAYVARKSRCFLIPFRTASDQCADLSVGQSRADVLRPNDQLDQVASSIRSAHGIDEHAEGHRAVWIRGNHRTRFYYPWNFGQHGYPFQCASPRLL